MDKAGVDFNMPEKPILSRNGQILQQSTPMMTNDYLNQPFTDVSIDFKGEQRKHREKSQIILSSSEESTSMLKNNVSDKRIRAMTTQDDYPLPSAGEKVFSNFARLTPVNYLTNRPQ